MKPLTKAVAALLAANSIPPEVVRAYNAAIRRYGKERWVSGIAVGRKVRRGRLVKRPHWVVAFHVKTKRAPQQVPARDLVPPAILGVATDVVQARYRRCAKTLTQTLCPGLAVANAKGVTGTIGAIVRDDQGERYLLTAGHVLSAKGAKVGSVVVDPAPGGAEVAIYSAIHKTRDVAIAALRQGVSAVNESLSGMRITKPEASAMDRIVQMFGAASGSTRRGLVIGIGGTSKNGTFPVAFIRPLSASAGSLAIAGDSGAIWHDAVTGAAIGVHVEVDPNGDAVATMAVNAVSGVAQALKRPLQWT